MSTTTITLQGGRGESHLSNQKLAQPIGDLIPYPPEDFYLCLQWRYGGIVKRPMSYMDCLWKDGTGLLRSVAYRDGVVERLPDKFPQTFRSVVSDVYTELLHALYRQRM